jgi:hypothetical protein
MGAMALHGYSSMELKSRSFTSKEPQVADPCYRPTMLSVADLFLVWFLMSELLNMCFVLRSS